MQDHLNQFFNNKKPWRELKHLWFYMTQIIFPYMLNMWFITLKNTHEFVLIARQKFAVETILKLSEIQACFYQ